MTNKPHRIQGPLESKHLPCIRGFLYRSMVPFLALRVTGDGFCLTSPEPRTSAIGCIGRAKFQAEIQEKFLVHGIASSKHSLSFFRQGPSLLGMTWIIWQKASSWCFSSFPELPASFSQAGCGDFNRLTVESIMFSHFLSFIYSGFLLQSFLSSLLNSNAGNFNYGFAVHVFIP